MNARTQPSPLPSTLRDRVLATASVVPSTNRAQGRMVRVALAALSAMAILFWLQQAAPLAASRSPLSSCVGIALPIVLATLATIAAARGRRGMLSPARRALALRMAAAVAGVTVLIWLGSDLAVRRPDAWFGGDAGSATHPPLWLALAPVATLFAWLLPTDPERCVLEGAAIGALGGAWTWALCGFGCPAADAIHALMHHAIFIPMGAAAGGVIAWLRGGRRLRGRY